MNILGVAFIVAGVLFAFTREQILILYFLLTVGLYIAISYIIPGAKNISNRKKFMVATWNDPNEGVIQVRVPCRVEKVQELIKKSTQQRLTITHFVIKAAGKLAGQSQDINGKLTFGRFVPHDTIDISCLVDIEGGKDLALVLVKEVDKKSVKDIARFIKEKGGKIKKSSGDEEHKKRTKVADFFPAFLVSVLVQIASFFTNKIGLNIPALGLTRHQFGAGCVTSLGMLNFQDATAPFSGFTGCCFLVAANAVHQEAVVEDGKIVVGRVINCNFVVDHRYVDGGRAKTFVKAFRSIFENPELYIDSSGPKEQKEEKNKKKN